MIVIEVGRNDRYQLAYRFTCARCGETGAYHTSLNDAERSGERHRRVKHAEAVSA